MGNGERDDAVQALQHGDARAQAVQSAHANQRFERALAHLPQIDPARKVLQAGESSPLGARRQDGLDRSLADVLHGSQAESDGGPALAMIFRKRIMGLQVRRLDGDHTVIGGMGLVEAITGEVLPIVEHRRRRLPAYAFLHRPLDELLAVHLERLGFLLGNGLAQPVRFCRSVAGHLHGGEHDLLLIDGNSIGLLKDRGQRRVPIR